MSKSVIIAESSPAVAKTIAEAFEEHNYQILAVCHDGLTALQAARQSPPDIVSLDLIMPRLSGLQLASNLSNFNPSPLLIAISAVTARPRLLQAKEAGIRYYILKPLANDKLREVLAAQLAPQATHSVAR